MTNVPILTFPKEEAKHIRRRYAEANIILEYGSGGSTYLGASLADKLVFSVESDRNWALNLQRQIDTAGLPSPAIVKHIDIGETGDWGRPKNSSNWRKFYQYPTSIWNQPYFRDPDLILIDGRFRAACFVASFIRVTKPTIVLFDDYLDRKSYHVVEKLASIRSRHGRMAEFVIEPGVRPIWIQDLFCELIGDVNYDDGKHHDYNAGLGDDVYPFDQSL